MSSRGSGDLGKWLGVVVLLLAAVAFSWWRLRPEPEMAQVAEADERLAQAMLGEMMSDVQRRGWNEVKKYWAGVPAKEQVRSLAAAVGGRQGGIMEYNGSAPVSDNPQEFDLFAMGETGAVVTLRMRVEAGNAKIVSVNQ